MSEVSVVRGLIVDNDIGKTILLGALFEKQGGLIVATAEKARGVRDLVEAGEIVPGKVDVAFIDSDLGTEYAGGKEVLRFLCTHRLVRETFNFGVARQFGEQLNNPDEIVTVGTSMDLERSKELGSYSDVLNQPLIVDWETRPLSLSKVVAEVRRLKL